MDKDFVKSLDSLFKQGFVEKEFEFADHKWKMRTLNDLEKVWVDQYVDLNAPISFLSARRVPTLAIAIKTIDGKSIADIFGTKRKKPLTDNFGEAMLRDPFRNEDSFLAANNLREFLDKQPTPIIDRLYYFFTTLENDSNTVLKKVLKEDEFFRGDSEASPIASDETPSDDGDGVGSE